jgi:flagellar basal-body rod protein FlgG
MDRSMMTAAVTMNQLQQGLDLIANNLANLNTNGYKSRSATFSSLLAQNMTRQPDETVNLGRLSPLGIRLGTGARVADTRLKMDQGSIRTTGRALDFALTQPDLFFTVSTTGQEGLATTTTGFTRDGAFYLQPDANNPRFLNLVTASGQFVLDENGNRIRIPGDYAEIHVDPTGEVSYETRGGQNVTVGRLGIVQILRPQLLEAQGDNVFVLPDLQALGLVVGDVIGPNIANQPVVQQGALESSNVDLSEEMTKMMTLERSYEFNARSLSVADDMLGLINNLR